ncbi:unnamed protein product [Angiostrongylus costaricensis]|uniref:SPX domain-containing protein n=1 Tax=Angiostrongylus costaricensis TaxID=334426 RepID=A0A0R3PGP4_ANGCS|nr:unnamed protein product [Angiostrongylus costaricensis]
MRKYKKQETQMFTEVRWINEMEHSPVVLSASQLKHMQLLKMEEKMDAGKGLYEEELDVRLVLFDQMLNHVLRIDRIYRRLQ